MPRRTNDRAALFDTLARLAGEQGERSTEVFRRGDLEVLLYAPRGTDSQLPHDRDEIYFVAQGEGFFVYGENRQRFGPGDFLFVPAEVSHRFEDFSDDLAVWVVFFGPQGGYEQLP
jgi:mannose-6-phosphate isomerase-like protein (cupin superfamily)